MSNVPRSDARSIAEIRARWNNPIWRSAYGSMNAAHEDIARLLFEIDARDAQLARVSALPNGCEHIASKGKHLYSCLHCGHKLSEALVPVSRPERTPDDVLAHGRETAEAMGLDVVPIGGPVQKKRKSDSRQLSEQEQREARAADCTAEHCHGGKCGCIPISRPPSPPKE